MTPIGAAREPGSPCGGPYRAVLVDLFGTLIHFDATALPEMTLGGRRVRTTLPLWSAVIDDALPEVGVERFAAAVVAASEELERERATTPIERPSRERFRRALVHAGCDPNRAIEIAPVCARAHMRAIADATRFPPGHAAFLADVAAGHAVGIITNFDDTATAYEILARHGILAHARTVVVSEAVGLRKPHPALVRIALRDLDVSPADAVLIGDHAYEDVGAATAAGVDSIWIDLRQTGVAKDAPTPRHVVQKLTDALPLLR
jgi:FMN phosphatase YigB (HAD superfamily)